MTRCLVAVATLTLAFGSSCTTFATQSGPVRLGGPTSGCTTNLDSSLPSGTATLTVTDKHNMTLTGTGTFVITGTGSLCSVTMNINNATVSFQTPVDIAIGSCVIHGVNNTIEVPIGSGFDCQSDDRTNRIVYR